MSRLVWHQHHWRKVQDVFYTQRCGHLAWHVWESCDILRPWLWRKTLNPEYGIEYGNNIKIDNFELLCGSLTSGLHYTSNLLKIHKLNILEEVVEASAIADSEPHAETWMLRRAPYASFGSSPMFFFPSHSTWFQSTLVGTGSRACRLYVIDS
jgi:hypothetical protein